MKQQIIRLLERAKENGRTIGDVLAEVQGMRPVCLTCDDHGAVGNFLDTVPCPDCASRPARPEPTDAELAALASEFMMSGSCSTRYYFDDRGFARALLSRYGRPAVDAEYPQAAEVCAELYQVIGSLASDLGVFDHPKVVKALDNAADHALVHDDVLPFPSFERQPAGDAQKSEDARDADMFWNADDPERFSATDLQGAVEYIMDDYRPSDLPMELNLLCARSMPNVQVRVTGYNETDGWQYEVVDAAIAQQRKGE